MDIFLSIVTIPLLLNAIGVLYKLATAAKGPDKCGCECNQEIPAVTAPKMKAAKFLPGNRLMAPSSLVPITSFVPPGRSTLDSSYLKDSLTRIGTDLAFDISQQCPPDSGLLTAWERQLPLHTSCPAAFIIGARKAGTTSLYQYLSHHPDFEGIHLEDGPSAGETFHFSARYTTETWDKYMSKFPKQDLMTGDASVGNLVNCNVPKRILESCGNFSKVILLLRNPIERYLSNFRMRTRLGTRDFSNNTALSTVIKWEVNQFVGALLQKGYAVLQDGAKQWTKLRCLYGPSRNMLFEGLYYVHLMNWLCNYPAENIIIANSKEFSSNSTKILKQIYQFLGLKALSQEERKLITSFIFNKGSKTNLSHHQLQPTDRKKLEQLYDSYNKALFELLRWENVKW